MGSKAICSPQIFFTAVIPNPGERERVSASLTLERQSVKSGPSGPHSSMSCDALSKKKKQGWVFLQGKKRERERPKS
jgi:hypothetical protein